MSQFPSEAMMRRNARAHCIWWGLVGLFATADLAYHFSARGVIAMLVAVAGAIAGACIGGGVYKWTWYARARAAVEEALNPGVVLYQNNNWGPLWRKLSRRITSRP